MVFMVLFIRVLRLKSPPLVGYCRFSPI